MKIAFVHEPKFRILVHSQSIPILTYEIARRLVHQDCEVTIYAAGDRTRRKTAKQEGIHYCGLPTGLDPLLFKACKGWQKLTRMKSRDRPLFASQLYYPSYGFQLANELRKQQFDIVHLNHLFQYIPIIRAFNPTIKIVLHMHIDWLAQLNQKMLEAQLKSVDLILSCSQYITNRIQQRFPHLANRCQTLHNGVDTHQFTQNHPVTVSSEATEPSLLFVGRVSPEKGIHTLLDAFELVLKEYPKTKLAIVGKEAMLAPDELFISDEDEKTQELKSFYPGSYLEKLHQRMSEKVAAQVTFTGAIRHSKLPDYYHNASIFVFPSLWHEPFGMTLVEAMAAGLPVVATEVGGVPEIVEVEKTGFLVERGNVEQLADRLIKLLADEQVRHSMGQSGQQRVLAHFAWENVVKNLFVQYQKLLASSLANH
jgi:glycosyltransferase involved in cell wall biosynthesis